MSAISLVHGTIRQIRDRAKRDSGEIFGREASVLTELGSVLGETLPVLLFAPREGERYPELREGLVVSWIVEIDANRYGLNATFRRVATDDDIRGLIPFPAQTLDVEPPVVLDPAPESVEA